MDQSQCPAFLAAVARSAKVAAGPCIMCPQEESHMEQDDLSRRDFVSMTIGAGIAAAGASELLAQAQAVETTVNIKTPDGTCDAAFIHPPNGAYPGVIIWPDAFGH